MKDFGCEANFYTGIVLQDIRLKTTIRNTDHLTIRPITQHRHEIPFHGGILKISPSALRLYLLLPNRYHFTTMALRLDAYSMKGPASHRVLAGLPPTTTRR